MPPPPPPHSSYGRRSVAFSAKVMIQHVLLKKNKFKHVDHDHLQISINRNDKSFETTRVPWETCKTPWEELITIDGTLRHRKSTRGYRSKIYIFQIKACDEEDFETDAVVARFHLDIASYLTGDHVEKDVVLKTLCSDDPKAQLVLHLELVSGDVLRQHQKHQNGLHNGLNLIHKMEESFEEARHSFDMHHRFRRTSAASENSSTFSNNYEHTGAKSSIRKWKAACKSIMATTRMTKMAADKATAIPNEKTRSPVSVKKLQTETIQEEDEGEMDENLKTDIRRLKTEPRIEMKKTDIRNLKTEPRIEMEKTDVRTDLKTEPRIEMDENLKTDIRTDLKTEPRIESKPPTDLKTEESKPLEMRIEILESTLIEEPTISPTAQTRDESMLFLPYSVDMKQPETRRSVQDGIFDSWSDLEMYLVALPEMRDDGGIESIDETTRITSLEEQIIQLQTLGREMFQENQILGQQLRVLTVKLERIQDLQQQMQVSRERERMIRYPSKNNLKIHHVQHVVIEDPVMKLYHSNRVSFKKNLRNSNLNRRKRYSQRIGQITSI